MNATTTPSFGGTRWASTSTAQQSLGSAHPRLPDPNRVGRGGQSHGEERVRFEAGEVRCGGEDQNHKRGENFHGFGVKGGQGIGRESPYGVEERSHQRRG